MTAREGGQQGLEMDRRAGRDWLWTGHVEGEEEAKDRACPPD